MKKFIFPILGAEKYMPVYVRAIAKLSEVDVVDFKGYPFYVLIYTEKGQAIVRVNKEKYMTDKNKVIILDVNVPFSFEQATKKCLAYILVFAANTTEQKSQFPNMKPMFVSRLSNQEIIAETLTSVFDSCIERSINCGYKNSALLYSLILEIERQNFSAKNLKMQSKFSKLEQIIDYMEDNLGNSIALEDISEYCELSPQYICRLFKDYLRTRPFEYLLNLRIAKAKELLVETELNINQICTKVGFADLCYFSAAFKKVSGYTPTDFKTFYKI